MGTRLAYALLVLTNAWLEEARREPMQADQLRKRRMALQEIKDSLDPSTVYAGVQLASELQALLSAIVNLPASYSTYNFAPGY
jgi:hypothetical protein